MKKTLVIGTFCIFLVQLAIPFSMIAKHELILKNGEQFKFKTAPVDPYDAFRGRYVALDIEADKIPVQKGTYFESGKMVYAKISVDENGFAKFSEASLNKPQKGPYLFTKVSHTYGGFMYIETPFAKYYMEETKAPKAEKLYQTHSSGKESDAYITVRIKDGFGVVENLFVAGKKVEEALR